MDQEGLGGSTITKCFRHCGAFPQEQSDEDPFASLEDDDHDDTVRLQELVDQLGSEMTTEEYMAADNDLRMYLHEF